MIMEMMREVWGVVVLLFLLLLTTGPTNSAASGGDQVTTTMSGGVVFEIDYRGPETRTYLPPPELKRDPKSEYSRGPRGNRKKLHG